MFCLTSDKHYLVCYYSVLFPSGACVYPAGRTRAGFARAEVMPAHPLPCAPRIGAASAQAAFTSYSLERSKMAAAGSEAASPSPASTSESHGYPENHSPRASTGCWQKTLHLPKGQEALDVTGWNTGKPASEKESGRDKRSREGAVEGKGTPILGSHLTDPQIS